MGKSTLFNTLTKLCIPAENFPFCTIEPNEARVIVPDERFDWLCQLFKPKSEVREAPTRHQTSWPTVSSDDTLWLLDSLPSA